MLLEGVWVSDTMGRALYKALPGCCVEWKPQRQGERRLTLRSGRGAGAWGGGEQGWALGAF